MPAVLASARAASRNPRRCSVRKKRCCRKYLLVSVRKMLHMYLCQNQLQCRQAARLPSAGGNGGE